MPVLRPVIDEQQDSRCGHTLTQKGEKFLGFTVQPLQILEDEFEGLIETLAYQQPLHRVKRAPASDLWVHLLEGGSRVRNPQQKKEIGQGVFQATIEHEHFAANFLSPLALIIVHGDLKVILQQLNKREIRVRFAM